MSDLKDQLVQLRGAIDEVDQSIHKLLNKRAKCAKQIAEVKSASDKNLPYYRPEREAQVLRKIKDANTGPLSDNEVARVFRSIMSACLALEEPVRVAFVGDDYSFAHAAVLKQFGLSVKDYPTTSIQSVFRDVMSGTVHYGLVPIENSMEGVVNQTLDALIESPLTVCGEVALYAHYHVLRKPEERDTPITTIYGQQVAFDRCHDWIETQARQAKKVIISDLVRVIDEFQQNEGAALIVGDVTSEFPGLEKTASNIEDFVQEALRFLVIGQHPIAPSGKDKTALLMVIPHKPGALLNMLEPFSRHGINMTFIEVRPSRNNLWDYIFFIDVEGHKEDVIVKEALSELEKEISFLKILGSYPVAVLET